MAELNELPHKNDSVNESVPDISEKNIQNDLICNVDTKLAETENFTDTENTNEMPDMLDESKLKHEEIAEIEEVVKKSDSVNGGGSHVSGTNNIQNELHCDVDQKCSEIENVTDKEDVRIMKEGIKLLKLIADLQEVIINLLQQKLKLLNIKLRKIKNDYNNSVESLQKALYEALRIFLKRSGSLQIPEFQNILKIVNNTNMKQEKDFVDKTEHIFEEIHCKFLKYEEVYKTCYTSIENSLQKAEKVLNINILLNNYKTKRSTLFSIFEGLRLRLIHFRLASIKKAFDEFETVVKNYTKISVQNIDKIDLFLIAFEKAEFAYTELKSLIVEVLKSEYAEVLLC